MTFIPQTPRKRLYRKVQQDEPTVQVLPRPSQNHFDIISVGITDGVSSGSGIFDDSEGDPDPIFDYRTSHLELADALMRHGLSQKSATSVATEGIQSTE